MAKLVAAGADYKKAYLSFQEFFEKLRNEPERWGKPFSALLGTVDAQLELGAAAIGGKDSMSGTFLDLERTAHADLLRHCAAENRRGAFS